MKRIVRKYGPVIFHCINDFGQGSLAALIPFFIANFGLNYYQSASIIFCNTVVASVAQPVLGYVADRWRVPWFIPVGFTVTLVSISAMALATSYEMILALSLLAGVGAALFHPEAALLVNRTQSHEIGNAMGRFAVGGSAGFALGPFIAGGVYVFGGQFLWVFTLIALLGVLLYLYAFMGEGEADTDDGASTVLDELSQVLAVVPDILRTPTYSHRLGVQIVRNRGNWRRSKERVSRVTSECGTTLVRVVAILTFLLVPLKQRTVAVAAVSAGILAQPSNNNDVDGLAGEQLDGGSDLGAGHDLLVVIVVGGSHHLAEAGLKLVGTAVGDVLDHHQQRQNDGDEEAKDNQANANLGASAEIVSHEILPLFV